MNTNEAGIKSSVPRKGVITRIGLLHADGSWEGVSLPLTVEIGQSVAIYADEPTVTELPDRTP